MDELTVERVLRCVELVPPGRVASYGAIGSICGVGPRQVGSIMRHYGRGVAWWRITSQAGDLAGGLAGTVSGSLLDRARPHWDAEGIAVKPNGLGCRYREYEADLDALAAAWGRAVADLPAPESGSPAP